MKEQTQLAHPDFGVVQVRVCDDNEISLKQFNERIYLTPQQLEELVKILNNIVRELV